MGLVKSVSLLYIKAIEEGNKMKNQSKNPYFSVKVQKAVNKLIANSYMAGHLFEFMVCAAGKDIRG